MSDRSDNYRNGREETFSDITRNDRFSTILTVAIVLLAVAAGLALRQRTTGQTWYYENREAGIEAYYPAGWLVDESGQYVVRIRDPRARPFKTQYRIAIMPAGGQTSIRNVLDSLTIQRSTDLAAYRVLSVEEVATGNTMFTQMSFTFVDSDPDPFARRLPVVVQGLDIVIRDGDRAIVATYMADEDTFDEDLPDFERFLAGLRY